VCRSGVTYLEKAFIRPDPDGSVGGKNCPDVPISSSANVVSKDPLVSANAATADGETFTFKVGTGTVEWIPYPQTTKTSMTCDESNPCALVVQLYGVFDGVAKWVPYTFDLTYRVTDPIAGCGGVAQGGLSTSGSDRLTSAWIDWTVDACKRPGAVKGAPTKMSFLGEGPALEAFADGRVDLAYSAAGFDPAVGLTPAESRDKRASVAVPIGLNAVVIAAAGGVYGNDGHVAPYKHLRLTAAEVATLLGQGQRGIDPLVSAPGSPLLARNPELKSTGFFGSGFPVGAYSTSDSTSWFGTNYVKTLAPSSWIDLNGQARGADASLALAVPTFQNVLELFTGRPSLEKGLLGANGIGGSWILTDLATARAYGLSVVGIENAAGDFVEPTAETMDAALSTMSKDAGGLRLPGPQATVNSAPAAAGSVGQAGGVDPYPMTFVEYAVVPEQVLVDSQCVARTDSQALLTDWLTYITGDGQAQLPDGMLPLTDELKAEATSAIAQVGSVKPDCLRPSNSGGTGGDGSADGSDNGGGGFGGSSLGAGSGSRRTSSPTSGAVDTTGDATDGSSNAAADAELAASLPDYEGSNNSNGLIPLLALGGIVLLTTFAALLTSANKGGGKSPLEPVIEHEDPAP
jgi:hypothetical protein